jgi:hypothetical protein
VSAPAAPRKAAHDYEFLTRWRVPGEIGTVYAILNDVEGLTRWWSSVYLEVTVAEPGDALGVGKLVHLHTKGRLPYTLRWSFRVTAAEPPKSFSLEARGDFVGRGVWTLRQDGGEVDVIYDWRIRAEKPLLRSLSFALKPFFEANHRWAMDQGLIGLREELQRREGRILGTGVAVSAKGGSSP